MTHSERVWAGRARDVWATPKDAMRLTLYNTPTDNQDFLHKILCGKYGQICQIYENFVN